MTPARALGSRVACSLAAVLVGWLAACGATLPLEFWELGRNAAPGHLRLDVFNGSALWLGFTLLVVCGVWVVLVLPIAVLVPAGVVVRYWRAIASASGLSGALFVAWRLELWKNLMRGGPENPFGAFILHLYVLFAVVFAVVVTGAYSRLLARGASGSATQAT